MPSETLSEDLTGERLDAAIRRAAAALLRYRRADGHFVFPLEADATVPAEYVLLEHYLDRIEPELERKIGVHLRAIQGAHGGWPLFHGGALDISASVKAYFALKAIGDAPEAPHMRAGARGDPRGGRRGAGERVHPRPARAVRRGAVARGTGDPG